MQNGHGDVRELGAPAAAAPSRPAVLAVIWDFWKAYAERIAFYQTGVILLAIYVVVVGPIWLVARLTGHQFLPVRLAGVATYWHPAHMGRITAIEELKKQG